MMTEQPIDEQLTLFDLYDPEHELDEDLDWGDEDEQFVGLEDCE